MDTTSLFQILVIVGIVFIASELFIGIQTGFDLVLLGLSLLIGGVVGLGTNNLVLSLIITLVLTIGYIVFGRSVIKKKVLVLTHHTNIDKLIGSEGIVIRTITPDTTGMVRVCDEDWRAKANETIFEKENITVNAIEGVTLHVSKKLKK